MPSGGKELYCTLWRRLLMLVRLVALETISPRKGIYYGTLRCRTLPTKRTYQGSDQLCSSCDRFFSRTFLPTKGRD